MPHTPISTVVHAEVVCAQKILPIGIFLSHTLRSKIIAPWDIHTKTPRAFRWKRSFSARISKSASLWLGSSQSDWTRPRKRLGYEFNFLSTACGTVDEFTICTQAHTSPYSILRGLPRALKLGLFSLKRYRRWTDAVKLTAKRILNELKVAKFQVCTIGNFGESRSESFLCYTNWMYACNIYSSIGNSA